MNDRVRHILGVALEMPEQQISESLSAEDTSNWDSIRHLNLVLALEEAGGQKPRAADLLQVSYKTLLQKIKDYGLER